MSFATPSQAADQTTSSEKALYTSTIKAIRAASGRAILHFEPGRYRVTLGNSSLNLTVAPLTRAIITFQYANSTLKSFSLTFSNPITVTPAKTGHTLLVKSMKFDSDGFASEIMFVDQNGNPVIPSNQDYQEVSSFFEIELRSDRLFEGSPFRRVSIEGQDGQARFVDRAQFIRDESSNLPGLLVELEDDAIIRVGVTNNGLAYDNRFKILSPPDNPSKLQFALLDADFAHQVYRMDAAALNFHFKEFQFKIGQTELRSTNVSSATLTRLRAAADPGSTNRTIVVDAQRIEAKLAKGSTIRAMDVDIDSQSSELGTTLDMKLASESQATLVSFEYRCEENRWSSMSFASGSTLKIDLDTGSRIPIGDKGWAVLDHGSVDLETTGDTLWHTDKRMGIRFAATARNFKMGIRSAKVPVGKSGFIEVQDGEFDANQLEILSKARCPIQGEFQKFVISPKPGTRLPLSDGFSVAVGAGAKLEAEDASYPARFDHESTIPLGRFHLSVPAFTAGTSTLASPLNIESGSAQAYFETYLDNGVQTITSYAPGTIQGTLNWRGQGADLKLTGTASDVRFSGAIKDGFAISGSLAVQASDGGGLHFVEPAKIEHADGHDDFRLFPVTFNIVVGNGVTLVSGWTFKASPGSVSFGNLSQEQTLDSTLVIPKGVGEYVNPDNIYAGGKNDDDDYAGKQEVARDTQFPGHWHVYVDPGSYPLTVQYKFVSMNNRVTVQFGPVDGLTNIKQTLDGLEVARAISDGLSWLIDVVHLPHLKTIDELAAGVIRRKLEALQGRVYTYSWP